MNKMYFLGCIGILAASAMLSSCSSDNDDPTPSPNPGLEVVYKWTTDGGLKACDHILFGTDDKENASGTQIGNGDQEFVFTGKQTLKKGTYLLKGWVYIANGAVNEPINLTKREKELLVNVAEGLSNREISEKMFLSEGTVRNNISALLLKLKLRDRTQLAVYAVKNDYI